MRVLVLAVAVLTAAAAKNITVLVVGDSWGALGPNWKELQDMFARHGVGAEVKSAARSGTTACQWASNAAIIKAAAQQLFPDVSVGTNATGPDFVWYTLGGNDLVDKTYESCSNNAKSLTEQMTCMDAITKKATDCGEKVRELTISSASHAPF